MNIDRAALKNQARGVIHNSNPKVIYAGLLYLALCILVNFLSIRLLGVGFTEENLTQYMQHIENGNLDYAIEYLRSLSPAPSAYFIDLAMQIVSTVVSVGFVIFLLNTIRGAAACFGNLLDGFGIFFRIILLSLLQWLFITLWTLLFIVPGIIAAYRYRQATYIMLDHPEMSVLQCISESKRMMKGHKWELFVLDLSFIGWSFLALIPYIGYAVQVWTLPYISTTLALYYEALRTAPSADDAGGSVPFRV